MNKKFSILFIILLIGGLFSACSQLLSMVSGEEPAEVPAKTEAVAEPQEESPTEEVVTETAAAEPDPVDDAPTEELTAEPTLAPTEEPIAAVVEIIHEQIPTTSQYLQSQVLVECNTGYGFASAVSYTIPQACDSWRNNLLERPLSADLMSFYPFLDIVSARAGKDGGWYFIRLDLFDATPAADASLVTYFAELDVDFNGRGDYLLAVEGLSQDMTEWTVAGVRAWKDGNHDVGSLNAVYSDESNAGDGYETILFDQGIGDDADLVWARFSPDSAKQIEFAFKESLLGGKSTFLWWVGAMQGGFSPNAFDYVDGQDTATTFSIDTTCGWPFGANVKNKPKQCYIPEPTAVPTNPASSSCVKPEPQFNDPCYKWYPDLCKWQWDMSCVN